MQFGKEVQGLSCAVISLCLGACTTTPQALSKTCRRLTNPRCVVRSSRRMTPLSSKIFTSSSHAGKLLPSNASIWWSRTTP